MGPTVGKNFTTEHNRANFVCLATPDSLDIRHLSYSKRISPVASIRQASAILDDPEALVLRSLRTLVLGPETAFAPVFGDDFLLEKPVLSGAFPISDLFCQGV